MHRLLPPILLCCLAICGGCAVLDEGHHPLLHALDEALPQPDDSLPSLALGAALLPVTVPAGLVDTFIAHPALTAPTAWESTDDLLWEDPRGSTFYQAAIFLPKVVATPIVFVFAWGLHCAVGE
ncbi:MAG: hypothetical protein QF903_02500 [Planctomycetota bacterium]|jgi:hypothetical protein|nr:hypothetical protein [Planctomycetota bacterium]MDP6762794.1 hypothetical protein [Planctomycetota bacterium]MDP6988331.1 hypothetical protein [Planctomycetota bacterium]